MSKYVNEIAGQIQFYEDYIKLVNPDITLNDIFGDNNDGVMNGNLLEFKLTINDLNAVLFQAIKYQSARRIKGKPVTKNIILVSLNTDIAYLYDSEDYLEDIEKVYTGAASVATSGFMGKSPKEVLKLNEEVGKYRLKELLKQNEFTKIHIDENCIVGWAKRYYELNKGARKDDFIGDLTGKHQVYGEIRRPTTFKDYIYPYEGKTNVKFNYLMGKLNDEIQKKDLGAFYTHPFYSEKSAELVREAIKRVPKGNDYVIIDRCAGTGNLEQFLSKEELSHTVVSTVEYYEYKVLLELYGSKVRYIVPPIEQPDTFNKGLVRGADALSIDYLNNPVINKFIEDEKCTIILYENPPYAETTSLEHQRQGVAKKSSASWKNSDLIQSMRNDVKGSALNDLGNVFIWSAFKYYLRKPTDSYIVYSPVKYWKAQHLINKKFLSGFAFNRRHFHTNIDACIMCALWSNEDDNDLKELTLKAYDIDFSKNELVDCGELSVKRVYEKYSKVYYEKRKFADEETDGILIGLNGLEAEGVKKRIKPIYSKDMLGYLVADSVGFDNPDAKSSLLIAGRYNGNGCYLHKDNYLEKLPMFAASRYITYNRSWTERARIMKSGDKSKEYFADIKNKKLNQFLFKVLLFTCFEPQNHMRSFSGSDARFYRNELCLDTTNGETVASKDINKLALNKTEEDMIKTWNNILICAKKTKNYNPKITYGLYQIIDELNTFKKDEESGGNIYDYPELNGHIKTLKKLVKDYYNNEIVPVLFEYEFLK